MKVTAFVSPKGGRFAAVEASVKKLFAAYESATPGAIDFHYVAVADDADRERAKDAGLAEMSFEEEGAKDAPHGFAGLVFEHQTEIENIKFLTFDHDDELDYWVAVKLRELVARSQAKKWTIGIPTGHGEPRLDEPHLVMNADVSLRKIVAQYFPMYAFADVDLGRPIPSTVDALLVTQPAKDYTDAELRAVDTFALSGKPVAIVASAVNVAAGDPKMQATLSTHRLETLTAGWGIEMKRNVVLDFGRSYSVHVMTTNGEEQLEFPALPEVNRLDKLGSDPLLDPSFAPFFRIPQIAMPLASELVLHPEKQARARLKPILRSTPKATRETGETVDLSPMGKHQPHGTPAVATLAASVEGELASAFDPSRHAKKAHVFVAASSAFFVNPLERAAHITDVPPGMMAPPQRDESLEQLGMPYAQNYVTGMILAAKNLLDWMTEPELAECLQP